MPHSWSGGFYTDPVTDVKPSNTLLSKMAAPSTRGENTNNAKTETSDKSNNGKQ